VKFIKVPLEVELIGRAKPGHAVQVLWRAGLDISTYHNQVPSVSRVWEGGDPELFKVSRETQV